MIFCFVFPILVLLDTASAGTTSEPQRCVRSDVCEPSVGDVDTEGHADHGMLIQMTKPLRVGTGKRKKSSSHTALKGDGASDQHVGPESRGDNQHGNRGAPSLPPAYLPDAVESTDRAASSLIPSLPSQAVETEDRATSYSPDAVEAGHQGILHSRWQILNGNSTIQSAVADIAKVVVQHIPRSVSLLGLNFTQGVSLRGDSGAIDLTILLRLMLIILLPVLVAFGCLIYMIASSTSSNHGKDAGHESAASAAQRASDVLQSPSFGGQSPGFGNPYVGEKGRAAGASVARTHTQAPRSSQDSLTRPISAGVASAASASALSLASSQAPSIKPSQAKKSGVNSAPVAEPPDVQAGVTVVMRWDIQPYRQNMDVDITSVNGTGKDKVMMRALLHELWDSCGVLLETFQGYPVAFLHTGKAVGEEGSALFPGESRKVSVFAASSTSSISDTPVMIVHREEGADRKPRILARRPPIAASSPQSNGSNEKGAAVFEVILDASGQPIKVVQMDGCIVTEVVRPKQDGFRILHITFGEDLWLGLAAVIAGRKLA